jgi:peptidoglycan hydrolase-like protein with peptidoglycan-binding domain
MKKLFCAAMVAFAFIPSIASANTRNTTAGSNTSLSVSNNVSGENLNRDDILRIQQSLNQRGFYPGKASGQWDANTVNALRRFQQTNSLSVNGTLDTNTLNELGVTLTNQDSSNTMTDESYKNSTTSDAPVSSGVGGAASTTGMSGNGSATVGGSISGSTGTSGSGH